MYNLSVALYFLSQSVSWWFDRRHSLSPL